MTFTATFVVPAQRQLSFSDIHFNHSFLLTCLWAKSVSVIIVIMQELEKQTLDYSCAMDAMHLSLDDIRRKSSEKDTKLEQRRDQYEKLEVSAIT